MRKKNPQYLNHLSFLLLAAEHILMEITIKRKNYIAEQGIYSTKQCAYSSILYSGVICVYIHQKFGKVVVANRYWAPTWCQPHLITFNPDNHSIT